MQRSSKGRKCEKSGASALRACSGMFLRLRPLVRRGKRSRFFASFLFAGGRWAGETLAFFRMLSLRGRPFARGNARIFSLVFSSLAVVGQGKRSHFFASFLFAGGRGAGETLAFFRMLSLRGRSFAGGNARVFFLIFSSLAAVGQGETLAFFRLLPLRGCSCGGGNARIFSFVFSLLASFVRSAIACKKFRSALRAEVFEFALQIVKIFARASRENFDLPGVFARGARARGAQRFAAAAR